MWVALAKLLLFDPPCFLHFAQSSVPTHGSPPCFCFFIFSRSCSTLGFAHPVLRPAPLCLCSSTCFIKCTFSILFHMFHHLLQWGSVCALCNHNFWWIQCHIGLNYRLLNSNRTYCHSEYRVLRATQVCSTKPTVPMCRYIYPGAVYWSR